ncbi:fms-related tyrosine kinase 3 ligand isoform X2 [Varanus komodoensis]|uniref:fms-related tyrosine kinase 3 ligand isoform X2 n=1 Tax=Varanus komodoensis TaxID=61221 RepID=UPI001CF7E2D1|nr:fms-related tyrosine kinase 3 ligand isoform X2 [Varanus komodoensis]
MTWHHGIPDSSVVLLLLLVVVFSAASEPKKVCIFQDPPLQTTSFSDDFEELKKYLLFDYPVFVPSNLKPDEFCLGLWKVHLIDRNLHSMIQVSGSSLKKYIQKIRHHTTFINECKINDRCVAFERTNISQFLEPIPSFLMSLANWMENLLENSSAADFHNCTTIQCLPEQTSTEDIG